MRIMQGDQYELVLNITAGETAITDEVAENVEIVIGNIRKDKENGVRFSDGRWRVPLTEAETFALKADSNAQVRVVFRCGDVIGKELPMVDVIKSLSKVVY